MTGDRNSAGSRPNYNLAACPHGAGLSGSAVSRLDEWFNTACFSQPAAFTFGNVGRTTNIFNDGLHNLDFALFKNTGIGPEGHVRLQIRAEAFNLLNTPQFGYPGMTQGTPQFGMVSSQANSPRLIQFGAKVMF